MQSADQGYGLSCQVTASNGAGNTNASSPTVSITRPLRPENTVKPQAYGTAALGGTLACWSGSWKGDPTITFSYQWLRAGKAISGGTQRTYTVQSADQGYGLSCQVTASNGAGNTNASSPTVSITRPLRPENTVKPQAYGTAALGGTLACWSGSWKGDPTITFSYQWLRAGKAISGGTQRTYTVQSADQGYGLSCQVTASNGAGNTNASSPTVSITRPLRPENTVKPQAYGTAALGGTLACWSGSWKGDPTITFSYQWLRAGKAISGGTQRTYTVQSADQGYGLSCQVTASNGAGNTNASSPTVSITRPLRPENTVKPQAYGTAALGGTLACWSGSWKGDPTITFSYQWLRAGKAISGGTQRTYTVQSADQGYGLSCQVTASNGAGNTNASSPTVSITPASAGATKAFSQHVLIGSIVPSNAGTPQAYGTAALGDTVFCSSGGWKGEPAPTFSYQWYRWNEKSSSRTKIAGATQAVYTVQSADVATNPGGEYLECQVTATNSAGHRDAFSQHVLIGRSCPATPARRRPTVRRPWATRCSARAAAGRASRRRPSATRRTSMKVIITHQDRRCHPGRLHSGSADVATNPGGEISSAR